MTNEGILNCSNANISGVITATSGTFTNGTFNNCTIKDTCTITRIEATTGTIGGFTINPTYIGAKTTSTDEAFGNLAIYKDFLE